MSDERLRQCIVHPRRWIFPLMAVSANPLTDAEKTDARRFCGYPAYGAAPVGFETWRFYQVYGLLEFRLNNLSPSELGVIRRYLATLTGLEVAIPRSGENLDTDMAAVWTRNRT